VFLVVFEYENYAPRDAATSNGAAADPETPSSFVLSRPNGAISMQTLFQGLPRSLKHKQAVYSMQPSIPLLGSWRRLKVLFIRHR
jgi:hypothetical protein